MKGGIASAPFYNLQNSNKIVLDIPIDFRYCRSLIAGVERLNEASN